MDQHFILKSFCSSPDRRLVVGRPENNLNFSPDENNVELIGDVIVRFSKHSRYTASEIRTKFNQAASGTIELMKKSVHPEIFCDL